ncbi:hypothetical protein CWI38_0166p0020 [Hamiltosporidium tvaerminnensis]|uniref:Uncharacterized protein n=1 Tax=Hamiltosporidium tvaerminnensis TaxID=1176355 RepID=A0A4Q9M065_9MICR|nr:hypothetical protein CWI38_0166p0020 [Hamiltosporidium tvaerminnensis]
MFGVIEDSRRIPTSKSFEELQTKLIARLDDAVLAVFLKNKIHICPRCKYPLYFSRKKLGRGFYSVEFKSENMLLQVLDCWEEQKDTSARRAEILKAIKLQEAQTRDDVVFCYIQDRSVLYGVEGISQHCNRSKKKMLKMLVVRCIHLLFHNKYNFESLKRIKSQSVQEIIDKEYAEIRVDTRTKTDVKIRGNRPDIIILDKRQTKISLIEIRITSQESLQIVETEKLKKYDLCANELDLIYKCNGIVTKYHKTYVKRLQIPMNMHKQPTPLLKQVDNEKDGEPKTNTNEGLELEEEQEVVEMVEKKYIKEKKL